MILVTLHSVTSDVLACLLLCINGYYYFISLMLDDIFLLFTLLLHFVPFEPLLIKFLKNAKKIQYMFPVALHDAVTSDDIICLRLCLLFVLVVFISSLVLDEICYPLQSHPHLFPGDLLLKMLLNTSTKSHDYSWVTVTATAL